jgi:hypothetical protein
MRSVVYKVLTGVVVAGTLAFGGTALASAGTGTPAVAPAATAIIQSAGDQSLPVTTVVTEAAAATAVDTDNIQDENGADDATEVNAPETEGSEGAEAAESAIEKPGDGGHADEVAGAAESSVDHQFDGEE